MPKKTKSPNSVIRRVSEQSLGVGGPCWVFTHSPLPFLIYLNTVLLSVICDSEKKKPFLYQSLWRYSCRFHLQGFQNVLYPKLPYASNWTGIMLIFFLKICSFFFIFKILPCSIFHMLCGGAFEKTAHMFLFVACSHSFNNCLLKIMLTWIQLQFAGTKYAKTWIKHLHHL